MKKIYIIAEAGVNHNGEFDIAREMILEAKKAGASAIKFQTFKAENLVSYYAPKASYQNQNTNLNETQKEMLKKLELSFQQFRELAQYARELEIDFLSTPFDEESIEFLKTLNMSLWKIPSGEITNLPYLMKIAETKLPIILSTGMSTLQDITEALEVFREYSREDITLLHCNTEYPTQYYDVNLNVMDTLRSHFNVNVGYSDHTQGTEISIAAAALGATVIEKHFTLDRNMEGPDHKASLEPNELSQMIKGIRNVENALGSHKKEPTPSEIKNKTIARKSIVARTDIKKGDVFSDINLTVKRPGDGISPMEWFQLLGKTSLRDYTIDEKIDETSIDK